MSGQIDDASSQTSTVRYLAGGWTVDGRPNRKSWLKVVRSPLVPETALKLSFADDIYPHSRDTYGNTLLHYAAHEGNVDFCKHLANNGWHVLERNNYGRSPIDFSGNLNVRDFLTNHARPGNQGRSSVDKISMDESEANVDSRTPSHGLFLPVCEAFDPEAGDWNLPEEILSVESWLQNTEEKGDPELATDKHLEGMIHLESSSHQDDVPLKRQAEPRRDRSLDFYSNVKLVTPKKVCDTLDISEEHLWQLVEEGSIPSYCIFQMGALIRFNLTEILERGFA